MSGNAPEPPPSFPSLPTPSQALQTPTAPPRRNRSPTLNDTGDPVAVLAPKSITESNKTNLDALASVLESFGDFRKNNSYSYGKEGALQLLAVTKLLRNAVSIYGDPVDRPITGSTLRDAVEDIKTTIHTSIGSGSTGHPSYANAARGFTSDSAQFKKSPVSV
ncbi:hypothetical protein K439DRAFT_1642450 [Ramaria rubella]|nr:hypothetical protein K439DRAFT_1642450 [Ramaria rubella]